MAVSSRSYVFTLNNPDGLLDFSDDTDVRYAIYQEEVGENGTPHLQGYIELKKPARLSRMQRMIPGAHFEIRRGTRLEAKEYASKEDTRVDGPYEFGVWHGGGQGKRTDLLKVKKALDERTAMAEIADTHFTEWVKYYRAFEKYANLKDNGIREDPPEVWMLYGAPGTGKTRFVYEAAPNIYFKDCYSTWWDGYDGVGDIVLDDFAGQLPYQYLLRLLDRYPVSGQVKGGSLWIKAKRIFITSNVDPGEWYHKVDPWALFRRITHWRIFRVNEEPLICSDYYDFIANKPRNV